MGAKMELTPEIAEDICDWIAEGKTLRAYCRQEGKPSFKTVYRWIAADEEFAKAMEAARKLGARFIGEECVEIADDASNDWMESMDRTGKSVGWELNKEHVQRSKLRIETRLKLLAKWHPKEYGDKVDVTSDGEKLASMPPVVNVIIDSDDTDED